MPASAQGIRAGRAYVELFADNSRLIRGLNRAAARVRAFGGSVRAAGLRVFGAGSAIVAPLIAATAYFAKAGDQVQKMAQRTGFSTEALSQLGFAAEQSGSNLDALDKGLAGMARFSVQAERGLSTATDTLNELGLKADDLKGKSPEQQFLTLADALSKVEDPTKRAGLALQVFGRNGRELLPLLNQGAGGIVALMQQADRLGLTISQQDADAAAKLTDTLNILWRVVKAGVFAVGGALAPMLTRFAEILTNVILAVVRWVKENPQLIRTIFLIGVAVLAAGAALVVFGSAVIAAGAVLSGLATLLTVIGSVVGFLLSPIGLLIAAVVALGVWLVTSTAAGGAALEWLKETFGQLAQEAATALGAIGQALAAGDIGAAMRVLTATLNLWWHKGLTALETRWFQFKAFFLDVLTVMQGEAAKILTNLWAGFQVGLIGAQRVIDALTGQDHSKEQAKNLVDIEKDRRAALAEIDAQTERDIAARQRQTESDVTAAQQELDRARAEFESAVADANAAGEASGGSSLSDRFQALLDALAGAGSGLQTAHANTAGTFSGLAARQFVSGRSLQEQQLEAAQETAANTGEIRRKGGITYED